MQWSEHLHRWTPVVLYLIVCMASSLIPVQVATPVGHDLPDLSADSNAIEVQEVPNIQDTNDDTVGDISWCIQILQHLYITSLHQDKIHEQ